MRLGVTERIASALTPVLATKSRLCKSTRLFLNVFQNIPSIETIMTGFLVKTILWCEEGRAATKRTKKKILKHKIIIELNLIKTMTINQSSHVT